jgi:hypothetical protein
MFQRWCIGLILGTALAAGQPAPVGAQAWVLALDARGSVVGDLKPEEFQVKVDGKTRPILDVKTPNQTSAAPQSWVLVFEPIRDPNFRATAFVAAADFLTKVPEGDRVLIVARGKDSLESLMPGFSIRRGLWAEAMAKIPDMLPEALVGAPKETLQGVGVQVMSTDVSDGPAGQEALKTLLARFKGGAPGWAHGKMDQRGLSILARLNFNDPMSVRSQVATIKRESKALGSLFDLVAPVHGQKHIIVFSRCEADDMCHPGVKRAIAQDFKRTKGDDGGPAESATYATGEMTLLQDYLKTKAVAAGVTLFSVAGAGQNVAGLIGAIAPATGGFNFPLNVGLEDRFGQAIQVFGYRYLVTWTGGGMQGKPSALEISTSRKDVKILAQALM